MSQIVHVGELNEVLHETLSAIDAHENIEHIIKEEPESDFIVTVDPCEDANEYFLIEEYEEPSQPIEHPSVGTSKDEFLDKLLSNNHCFLCDGQTFPNPIRLAAHFEKIHLPHAVTFGEKMVVLCRLGCKKESHFHCPQAECLFSCKHKHRLRLHYNLNHSEGTCSDALTLLEELEKCQDQDNLNIKEESSNDFEDATVGKDCDDQILTEIYGDEDEMAEVKPSKVSQTLEGVKEMYQENMDEEGKAHFLSLLRRPSEKLSIGHSREELIAKLEFPYCYLCPDLKMMHRSRLERHFNMLHLGHHVKIANFFVALCKLECSRFTLAHYHCPYPNCMATVKVKSRLVGHFKKHLDYIHTGHQVTYSHSGIIKDVSPSNRWKKSILLDVCNNLPAPKKSFPFHGVPYFEHVSIGESADEMYNRLCLPFCYLCEDRKEYIVMSRLERHFRMAHLNRAVDCGSCYLILCGLECIPGEGPRKHYHCPYCQLKDQRRCAFLVHLEMHRREGHVADQMKKLRSETGLPAIDNDDNAIINDTSQVVTISLSDAGALGAATTVTTTPSVLEFKNKNPLPPPQPWNEKYMDLPVRKIPSLNNSVEAVLAAAGLPFCYLCNDNKDYIVFRRLKAHMTRCHIKPMLRINQILVLMCKRYCSDRHQDHGHYHCLFCDFCCRQKQRVEVHVIKHLKMIQKRSDTAEYHLPETKEDHSIPDHWVSEDERADVQEWEKQFFDFVDNNYSKKAKTNNNVMTERKKYLIFNHTRFGMDIEDKSLKYWVRFRGVKVISCEQLEYRNVLVLPLTKYNNDEENRAIDVQPEPLEDGCFDLTLNSTNPEQEFLQSYRIIPTREELFKLLYKMHIVDQPHPTPKSMFADIRRKFLYFPRAVVDKYVSLCPHCCTQFPDKSNEVGPVVTLSNADTINMAALQVSVVDMTAHQDGQYRYVVECFDRCSRMTWLVPAERCVGTELAESVIRCVLSVIGLPRMIITNCGHDFTEKMLLEIDRRWYGACNDLLSMSRDASHSIPPMPSDDLMDALNELVTQTTSWASALPHLQFRLNHTRGQQTQDQSPFEQVFGRQRSRPTWQRFLNNNNNNNNNGTSAATNTHANMEEDLIDGVEEDEEEEEEDTEDMDYKEDDSR